MIELYRQKQECCGCGACAQTCPKGAIRITEDEYGFPYPVIEEEKCINCGKCKRVCAFQNQKEENCPIVTYAAVSRAKDRMTRSASGGIFDALARCVLEQGGYVCGAAFDEEWTVRHILTDYVDDLWKLQGSKYVQSDTGRSFIKVKQLLAEGRTVLYSGTPCQIAGLKSFLGKEYDRLILVDIVCHGVPAPKMFREYLELLKKQENGTILDFTFRDKSIGWGKNGHIVTEKDGRRKKKILWQSASSYFYYFSQGWIQRESCYSCKYTNKHRPGDITLGDFWGIEKVHPEYGKACGWREEEGISLCVANTEKGAAWIKELSEYVDLKSSDFDKAAAGNAQLRNPVPKGRHDDILSCFEKGGWEAVDARFKKSIGIRKYSSQLKSMLPAFLRRWLKSRKRA